MSTERYRVDNTTTLGEFSEWVSGKSAIDTVRIKKPRTENSVNGYRAIAELCTGAGSPIIGESKDSIPLALDSLVEAVEELFPG